MNSDETHLNACEDPASNDKSVSDLLNALNQEIANIGKDDTAAKLHPKASISSLINTLSTQCDEAAVACSKSLPSQSLGERLYALELKRTAQNSS